MSASGYNEHERRGGKPPSGRLSDDALLVHIKALHAEVTQEYDIDTLREGVEIFSGLSRDHISLEEYLIYPQVLADLDAQERATMDAEMMARRAVRSTRASRR